MSTEKPFFRHEYNTMTMKDEVKHVKKENVIDGNLGLSFSYTELKGDDFYKIQGKMSGDKATVMEKKNDKEETMELDEKKLMAMIEKNKNLKFLADYMKKDRKKLMPKVKATAKRTTKKSSKKSSKKKPVKKGSKKSSKKKTSRKSKK